jgi:hypothetical protein
MIRNLSGKCDSCNARTVRLVEDKSYSKDCIILRCSNRQCDKKNFSERRLLVFWHSFTIRASSETYCWAYERSGDFIARELKNRSDHTIVDWKNFAREVCLCILRQDSETIGRQRKLMKVNLENASTTLA